MSMCWACTDPDGIMLGDNAVEIRGRAHHGYDDMSPFHTPRPRGARWLVVMAHGHYVPDHEWKREAYRAWKFVDSDIAATEADCIALDHWDRAVRIGDGRVPAYYSGSPDPTRTVNVIRLQSERSVTIDRTSLIWV
ncbi:MAG TPA: hypothetical protein VMA53_21160 [Stellaceae bacterium]|nr:hypothetical protein [Stellaceae bacterium]